MIRWTVPIWLILSGPVLCARLQAQTLPQAVATDSAIAAANRQPTWPYSLVGAIGGTPIGMAVGDLHRIRTGTESGYRAKLILVGAGVLVAGALSARQVAVRQLPDPESMTESEAIAARRQYVERLRRRRTNSLLLGAIAGLAAGFAVSAFNQ